MKKRKKLLTKKIVNNNNKNLKQEMYEKIKFKLIEAFFP